MTPSTQPTLSHSQQQCTHTTFCPSRTGEVYQIPITESKWPFRPPTSDPLPRVQPTPHPCHIVPSSVIVLVTAFPKEVSHGCPARRHIWYTRSQTCFTREKSDRSRAAELCKKGGKGMFSLPPSKISCRIPPTNHPFVPSLCFYFSFTPTASSFP